MRRYAWLELNEGTWYLLTSLCADPGNSTRTWSNSRHAILELMEEGWTVVRPYPGMSRPMGAEEHVVGYGLTRTIH